MLVLHQDNARRWATLYHGAAVHSSPRPLGEHSRLPPCRCSTSAGTLCHIYLCGVAHGSTDDWEHTLRRTTLARAFTFSAPWHRSGRVNQSDVIPRSAPGPLGVRGALRRPPNGAGKARRRGGETVCATPRRFPLALQQLAHRRRSAPSLAGSRAAECLRSPVAAGGLSSRSSSPSGGRPWRAARPLRAPPGGPSSRRRGHSSIDAPRGWPPRLRASSVYVTRSFRA